MKKRYLVCTKCGYKNDFKFGAMKRHMAKHE